MTIIPKPPPVEGKEFFDWAYKAGYAIGVRIVDPEPLSEKGWRFIAEHAGRPVPDELRYYYESCFPWGIWGECPAAWKRSIKKIRKHFEEEGAFFPIDACEKGDFFFAWADAAGRFRGIYLFTTKNICSWVADTMWNYVVQSVKGDTDEMENGDFVY